MGGVSSNFSKEALEKFKELELISIEKFNSVFKQLQYGARDCEIILSTEDLWKGIDHDTYNAGSVDWTSFSVPEIRTETDLWDALDALEYVITEIENESPGTIGSASYDNLLQYIDNCHNNPDAALSQLFNLNQTFKTIYAYLGAYHNYEYDFSDLVRRQKLKDFDETGVLFREVVEQEKKGTAAPISQAGDHDQYVAYYGTESAYFLGQQYQGMVGLMYSLYGVSQSVNAIGNATRGIIQQRGALRIAITRHNILNRQVAELSSQLTWRSSAHGGGTAYRYITEGELQPIQKTGLLRGGLSGRTYFTKESYDSGAEAQSKLALGTKPTIRVEFRIFNNPVLKANGTLVQRDYGQPGGGTEFYTNNQVRIQLISVTPLK
jgi:hypothetical protein